MNFALGSIIGKTLVNDAAARTIGFAPPAAAAELVCDELLDDEMGVLLELLLPHPAARATSPAAAPATVKRLTRVALITYLRSG
ncbi:MAG: hypothetical protein WAK93_18660 [Solirubrobacteraceae bacterium]